MAEVAPRPRGLSNRAILLTCLVGVFAIASAIWIAGPALYSAFCKATGYGGAVRRAAAVDFTPIARTVTVRFDTNVRGLPWTFTPEQTSQTAQLGKASMAYFKVRNNGTTALTGRAVYNLNPESAAAYFLKTQCFCFDDQTIGPGQEVEFPVIYYINPKFARDFDTRRMQELTLSYTFFPTTRAPKQGTG